MKCEVENCEEEIKKPFSYRGKKVCRDCFEEWSSYAENT
jgi:hypothetical protein